MNNNDMYLWHNGQTKEEIINIIKENLTPEKVAENIESHKRYLTDIVELVGKDGALHVIEKWKTQMYVPGLSSYEHTQLITNNFDPIGFVNSL